MSNEIELAEIQSELIRSALFKTIENEVKSKNYRIRVKFASKAGSNNFIGIVYRVFYGKEDGGDKEKTSESSLILKVAPRNSARRIQFSSRPCFLREIYMYNELLPYYRAFEESKGVTVDGFTEYPKCFRTIDTEPDESLLMEDLCNRGFKSIDRLEEELTADHVFLYLQALAKYHEISLALKDQQPEKFTQYSSNMTEIFTNKNNDLYRQYFKYQMDYVMNTVIGEESPILLEKLKKLCAKDPLDTAVELIDSEALESAVVVSYGDANQNNCMFKYDQMGKPFEICLIDWQTGRLASPVTDFLYFIFICTTKKLRDAHYDDFMKVYHESLSAHMRRLGSDPEKIFSYESMQRHLRKFGKFGLLIASTVLPAMTTDADNGVNLDELAEDAESGKEMDPQALSSEAAMARFRDRMRDIVVDMERLGYI